MRMCRAIARDNNARCVLSPAHINIVLSRAISNSLRSTPQHIIDAYILARINSYIAPRRAQHRANNARRRASPLLCAHIISRILTTLASRAHRVITRQSWPVWRGKQRGIIGEKSAHQHPQRRRGM